jgi:transposase-like protein
MSTQNNNIKIRKLPVFEEEKELSKFLETNFTESLKNMIKLTVKTMVKTEMEELRKDLGEKLYFNGTYDRNMTSTFGQINDIPIPRFRQSPDGMERKTLGVFDSEQQKFMKLVEHMHLLGISQRKIKKLAHDCFGIPISVTRVGAIYQELVEKEDVNINQKPLEDDYEYLLLDGIWETTKGYGWDDNKSVLLCALGVKPTGERRVIGFSLERRENTETWHTFVKRLKDRGLTGGNLKLVITDDLAAIAGAAERIYPTVKRQLCIAHKQRNVLAKTSFKHKREVADDVKAIFHAETKEEAMEQAKTVVKKWYMTEPKAMESLRFNLEYCFTYFSFPRDLWTKVRTTNLLEREFKEVRRRMKSFDNTFQNEASANRYANSIFTYLNWNYPLKGGLHTNA